MDTVANYIANLDLLYVGMVIFSLVILLILFKLIGRSIAIKKEKKLEDNPDVLGEKHDGILFRVNEIQQVRVNEIQQEKRLILLIKNPSIQHPSGEGKFWFKFDSIPANFRSVYKIFRVKKSSYGITLIEEFV